MGDDGRWFGWCFEVDGQACEGDYHVAGTGLGDCGREDVGKGETLSMWGRSQDSSDPNLGRDAEIPDNLL